jgi:hypothetical protein
MRKRSVRSSPWNVGVVVTPQTQPGPAPAAQAGAPEGKAPATTAPRAKDTAGPAIRIKGVRSRTYRLGSRISVDVSVKDASGIARTKVTLRRGGWTRTLRNGGRLRLSRSGSHLLRVTAKDRKGNVTTRTVRFRVSRR